MGTWRPSNPLRSQKGGILRGSRTRKSTCATALALVLGVVGVLVSALPAWALTPTVTGYLRSSGARGTAVTVTGTNFNNPPTTGRHDRWGRSDVVVSVLTHRSRRPCLASRRQGPPTSSSTTVRSFVGQRRARRLHGLGRGRSDDLVVHTCGRSCRDGRDHHGHELLRGDAGLVQRDTRHRLHGRVGKVDHGDGASRCHHRSDPCDDSGAPRADSATNFGVGAAPTITPFTPTSGSTGTSVTITGTNLTGVTAVKFNGTTATFTPSTATLRGREGPDGRDDRQDLGHDQRRRL